MPIPKRSFWLAVLAGVSVFGLIAYMWTRVEAQQRQTASLRDQLERMTNRIDLLTEVVEAASARATPCMCMATRTTSAPTSTTAICLNTALAPFAIIWL